MNSLESTLKQPSQSTSDESKSTVSTIEEELEKLSVDSAGSPSITPAKEEEQIALIEQEEQEAPKLDIDAPGHLNNLDDNQRELLFEFWALILEYLATNTQQDKKSDKKDCQTLSEEDFMAASTNKKNRELANNIKANMSSSNFGKPPVSSSSTSPISATGSSEKDEHIIHKHPLSNEFWAQLATDNPDVMLLRFLRARKWNLADAFSMYLECLKWRRRFRIQKVLRLGESAHRPELFSSGKGYFWGVDRHQRLIIYLTARLHNRNAQTLQETMNYTVYQIEQGRRLFQPGAETVVIVFDLQDAPLSSLDFGSMQFMISCFQSHYPESLSRVLVLHAPWIFWGFWRMIRPLLDPVVQEKVVFVDNLEHLKTFIAEDMLLEKFGGNCSYRYEFVPPLLPTNDDGDTSSMNSGPKSAKTVSPTTSSSTTSSHLSSTGSSSSGSTDYENIPPAGPIRLTDQQVQKIYKLLDERWKPAFLEATLHLCALRGDANVPSGHSSIQQWNGRRQEALKNCQRLLKRLELHYYPDHLYHRIGVIRREVVPGSGLEDGFEDYEKNVVWRN